MWWRWRKASLRRRECMLWKTRQKGRLSKCPLVPSYICTHKSACLENVVLTFSPLCCLLITSASSLPGSMPPPCLLYSHPSQPCPHRILDLFLPRHLSHFIVTLNWPRPLQTLSSLRAGLEFPALNSEIHQLSEPQPLQWRLCQFHWTASASLPASFLWLLEPTLLLLWQTRRTRISMPFPTALKWCLEGVGTLLPLLVGKTETCVQRWLQKCTGGVKS